jgi:hypothetical protein
LVETGAGKQAVCCGGCEHQRGFLARARIGLTIIDCILQSISCPSEGEARKRLHGEDLCRIIRHLRSGMIRPSRKIFGTFALQFP